MRILTLILFGFLHILLPAARAQPVIVVTGATLIDGTGSRPIPNAVVIIRAGRIVKVGTRSSLAIPRGAHVINASGKYLLPGLIDMHVHLEMVGLSDIGEMPARWESPEKVRDLVIINSRLDLAAGFTTVRDLGSTAVVLDVRKDVETGKVHGPHILAAGMQLAKRSDDAPSSNTFLEYDGPDSARAKVRSLVSMGVDVIKVRLTHMRPDPSSEELHALVDEAHRFRRRVTVHTDVPADDFVGLAIDAGADGIEHNAPLRVQDTLLLVRMAQRSMSLMAGAGAFYLQRIDTACLIDTFDRAQEQSLPGDIRVALHAGIDTLHAQTAQMIVSGWSPSQRQLRFIQEIQRARRDGVRLVFGTDCGANGMIHGEQYKAMWGESQMGSSPMQVIVMATRDAAAAIGELDQRGTIQAGKIADMIIVERDPLTDLRKLRMIYRVMKGGIVLDPADLLSAPSQ